MIQLSDVGVGVESATFLKAEARLFWKLMRIDLAAVLNTYIINTFNVWQVATSILRVNQTSEGLQ